MTGQEKYDYEERSGEDDSDYTEREVEPEHCSNCDYLFPSDELTEITEVIHGVNHYIYICSDCKKLYYETETE